MTDTVLLVLTPLAIALLAALALWHYRMVRMAGRMLRDALRREQRAVRDREEVISFLNRFSSSIVRSRSTDEWMWQVAKYLGGMVDAQAVRIFVLEDDRLRHVAHSGELPEQRPDDYRLTRSNRLLEELASDSLVVEASRMGEVLLSGRSLVEDDVSRTPEYGPGECLQSFLAVPLSIDDQPVGVLCAVNRRRPGAVFTTADVFLLETLSHQVALGATLVQVFAKLTEQQRIQQELQLAQRMQIALLPTSAPQSDQFVIHGVNRPAWEVSGDYYDFIEIDDTFVMVVIADGSGKGVSACLLMTMCRSLVRNNAARFRNNLGGLLREVNQQLYDDTDESQFVTMACCLIDRRDNTVEYARAGHTELLIRSARGTQVIAPDGPALGLFPNSVGLEFDTFYFSWLPRTSLLLYTDGVTEALDEAEDEFGLQRLIEVWEAQDDDPVATTSRILKEVEEFSQPRVQADDQTVLMLSRRAVPIPGDVPVATETVATD